MIKVTHIITGLAADGAENMLCNLVRQMDRTRFHNTVVSLTGMGDLGAALQADGIDVRVLGLKKKPADLAADLASCWRLTKLLRQSPPDVLHTWMYHADLLGGLIAQSVGVRRVVWGVHHASLDPEANKFLTLTTAKMCAMLSPIVPTRIVCCSESSRRTHAKFGYVESKTEFIPNGFDTEKFKPDAQVRKALRLELGVTEENVLIGMAGRFHANKDHENFVRASAILAKKRPDLIFCLCGRDITWQNSRLTSSIDNAGIRRQFRLLGLRSDAERFFAGIDIAVSSSQTEAFPLAVGEAMAAGTPCVVTDVGDSAFLVGDTGRAVPSRNAEALAEAIGNLIEAGSKRRLLLGTAARARIEELFSLTAIVERYQDLYVRVASN
jgi:glycosyltransferase involved in cell wall biosynthesis